MSDSKRLEELRRLARQHSMELEAVRWMRVAELAARWDCEPADVRAVAREELPYLPLPGRRDDRRYHPADVVRFEDRCRAGSQK